MSISTTSNSNLRHVKNVAYNFSDAQVKVQEATNNDPWGPSTVLMSEIADLTQNPMAFTEIMSIVWKRLNDSGNNWRHVYKSLVLLDFLIKSGHGEVAQQCRENVFTIETLKDFQHVEDSRDQGLIIREKADKLSLLLTDDQRLKQKQEFLSFLEKTALNADKPLGRKEILDLYKAQTRHPVPTDPTMHGWFEDYRTDLPRNHRAQPDQLAKLLYVLKNSMKDASLKVLLARFGISNIKKQQLIGYESKISLFQLGVPKAAKKPITPSQKVFYEQVAEEYRFDADLEEIIIHYLEPFEAVENQNSLPEAVRGKSQCLFGNIRELYMLHHRVVLEDLVKASTTLEICQVLTKHRKQIYITYRTYCQIHGSNQKVRDSVKNHPFFKDCQRKANHNMDMISYLLKPIQRIMKYQLLLGNIVDACPADVKDEVAMTRDSMVELLKEEGETQENGKEKEVVVKNEEPEESEEEALLMPFARLTLLRNIQNQAKIIGLPMSEDKLNTKLHPKYKLFKVSEITDLLQHSIRMMQTCDLAKTTSDVLYLHTALFYLHDALHDDNYLDDLDEFRVDLDKLAENLRGKEKKKYVARITVTAAFELILDTLLANNGESLSELL